MNIRVLRCVAPLLTILVTASTLTAHPAMARQPSPSPVQMISPRLHWGMSEREAEAAGATYFVHFLERSRPVLGFPQVEIAGVGFEVWLKFDQSPTSPGDERKRNVPATGLNYVVLVKHGECDDAGYARLKHYLANRYSAFRPESITGQTELKTRNIAYVTSNKEIINLGSLCAIRAEEYRGIVIELKTPVSD